MNFQMISSVRRISRYLIPPSTDFEWPRRKKAEEQGERRCKDNCGMRNGKFVALEPVPTIPVNPGSGPGQGPGIQSSNGCIQILPILWMPDQVRHDECKDILTAEGTEGAENAEETTGRAKDKTILPSFS